MNIVLAVDVMYSLTILSQPLDLFFIIRRVFGMNSGVQKRIFKEIHNFYTFYPKIMSPDLPSLTIIGLF